MMDLALHTVKVNQNNMLPIPNNCHAGVSPNIASIMHSKRPIAPAVDKNQAFMNVNNNSFNNNNSVNMHNNNDGKYGKKKYNYNGAPYGNQQTPSVVRRNARERSRVKQLNDGYHKLRLHIPQKAINQITNSGRGTSRKLSKVDTLKVAVEYIGSLQRLLEESEKNSKSSSNLDNYYSNIRSSNSPSSPAPSFISEASTSGTTYSRQPSRFKLEPYDQYDQSDSSSSYSPHETNFAENHFTSVQPSFKNENYEEFETSINHEEEELLDDELIDTITWWQQQQ